MFTDAKKIIIEKLVPLFEEKGFEKPEEDTFVVGGTNGVKIEYNEKSKAFDLKLCSVHEGGLGDWSVVSTWLFDETSDLKDAKSIANDFEETLREQFQLKVKKRRIEVNTPGGSAGSSQGAEALAQRFMVLFPQYKEKYKEDSERYGAFLADDFFSDSAVPKMLEILKEGNKKQITKFFTMLNEFYESGDPEVRSIITATIISNLAKYPEYQDTAFSAMDASLKRSATAMVKLTGKRLKRARY